MSNRVSNEANEEFVANVIQQFDPTVTISKETSFYDLFIRFYNITVLVNILAVLADFEELQSFDNTSMATENYDNLLGIHFFEREVGDNTTAVVALAFDSPTSVFTVRTSDEFIVNNLTFFPTTATTILRTSYVFDQNTQKYLVKIPTVSQDIGSASAVNIGDPVTVPYTNLVDFDQAFVDSEVTIGEDTETNEQALTRLREQKRVENLISRDSIRAQYARVFPGVVKNSEIVGMGEPEMFRDLIPTQIPQRRARLLFSEPLNITLTKAATVFYYNRDTSIVYQLKEDGSRSVSDEWETHPSGNVIWDVDLELVSLENPLGFVEDIPFRVDVNGSLLSSVEPRFVSGIAYTIPKPVTVDGSPCVEALVHRGSFTDIYVNVETNRVVRDFTIPVGNGGVVTIPDQYKPVLKVHAVKDTLDNEVAFFAIDVVDKDLRFSALDTATFLIDPALSGQAVSVEFTYAPFVQSIHAYTDAFLNRIVAATDLVKFFCPVFTSAIVEVSVVGGPQDSENILRTAFFAYLNSLTNTDNLPISKISSALHAALPELDQIISLSVFATQYMPDGSIINLEAEDTIIPVVSLDQGVSARTTQFLGESIEFVFL
jgi:hypothetical protein